MWNAFTYVTWKMNWNMTWYMPGNENCHCLEGYEDMKASVGQTNFTERVKGRKMWWKIK